VLTEYDTFLPPDLVPWTPVRPWCYEAIGRLDNYRVGGVEAAGTVTLDPEVQRPIVAPVSISRDGLLGLK
jgi:hypothetical protein